MIAIATSLKIMSMDVMFGNIIPAKRRKDRVAAMSVLYPLNNQSPRRISNPEKRERKSSRGIIEPIKLGIKPIQFVGVIKAAIAA